MKSSLCRPGWSGVRPAVRYAPGVTLLEMTVIILVLLSLVTVLFIGGSAWKKGSDRALCIMNLESVQKGVRGYTNLYGYNPGDTVADLEEKVIGLGKFVEATPVCPGEGSYETLGNQIPPIGTLYLTCALAEDEKHEPRDKSSW